MARRRIDFKQLDLPLRESALDSLMVAYVSALQTEFPAQQGYEYTEEMTANNRMPSWSIVRGEWFGLAFFVQHESSDSGSWMVRVTAFFPRLEAPLLFASQKLDVKVNFLVRHIVAPILMVLGALVVPFDLVNRSAKLFLRSDINKAVRRLDSICPELRAAFPGEVVVSKPVPRFALYGLLTLTGGALTIGFFWLANLFPRWSTVFNISGTIAVIITSGLLIGMIMTALGYSES